MKELKKLECILLARAISKNIQTLSWNLAKLEKSADMETLPTNDYSEILEAYTSVLRELPIIYNKYKEIEDENMDDLMEQIVKIVDKK